MADNYLENKMEEHRRMQSVARPIHRPAGTSGLRPGVYAIKLPELNVVVTNGDSAAAQAIIAALKLTGAPVDFTASDNRRGTALAQSTGARFHPGGDLKAMIERTLADRGHIDLIVAMGGPLPDYITGVRTITVGSDLAGVTSDSIKVDIDSDTAARRAADALIMLASWGESRAKVRI